MDKDDKGIDPIIEQLLRQHRFWHWHRKNDVKRFGDNPMTYPDMKVDDKIQVDEHWRMDGSGRDVATIKYIDDEFMIIKIGITPPGIVRVYKRCYFHYSKSVTLNMWYMWPDIKHLKYLKRMVGK